jgi:hypothetical protein
MTRSNTIRRRKIEEKRLFFRVLEKENNGDKALTMLEFNFFERCFNIQRSKSLMPKKLGHRRDYLNAIEDMVNLALIELEEHGYETESLLTEQ